MEFSSISSFTAFVCYSVATISILSRLFHPKGPNLIITLIFACLAIVFHVLSSSQFLFTHNNLNFSLPNVVSLVSLIITLVISTVALRFKVNLLLPVIYGFAGLWQLSMIFISPMGNMEIVTDKLAMLSHITLALIAYCILVIATLYAFQVAYINTKLKNKNLQAVHHLPPLMQVERQLYIILLLGSICLLFSQVLGFLFLDGMISNANAHKTILSLIACSIYFLTLWGHFKQGWRGQRVLVLTVIATFILTLAYFGSRFVKEFLLL
ncbi:inner membrane protein YpjD [Colwellia sp. C1TZA3]|uniref:cytochrome C assembly family protein n=1 Tax=Colwellia sp. C1TZA3 TaxID=2508879 RepID=UPI0011BA29FC|nr:cytochrome c biogenesis protein CcsA [Colwellia sp. C1TZA3]TWX72829.1 cytochrome C assembly family protein [Colwellia sp. C1TZA3]